MTTTTPLPSFGQQWSSAVVDFPVSSLRIIEVTGPDAAKFLQGQLTCDMAAVNDATWVAGGYCDAKGKLWSTFRIFAREQGFWLLVSQHSLADTLTQLKKYAVFSKVAIQDISAQWTFTAHWGAKAAEQFQLSAEQVKAETPQQILIALHTGLVLNLQFQEADKERSERSENESAWWCAAELELGWVNVPAAQGAVYIPQMLNLDLNQGINFKKGCYIGQETIARMHYKGQNKRRTRCFTGSLSDPAFDTAGATLEMKIGENWRRAGAVLTSVRYHKGVVAILAVVPTELETDAEFRLNGQNDSQFTLCPLEHKMEPHS
ncbi:CAF17-like 4Fe-4S cluster assembly/insertion protein YgfZ [Aliidiomarina celeris]|uniref:CAF17-like 4Fe-4S cluster assembly/insertion protein YgfZ n=1 Tax=Aliidiomarina celeris TaxID=2249428 RepID=UPI0018E5FD94|nr:hypothetical protein [Aliidiomarina celeris]